MKKVMLGVLFGLAVIASAEMDKKEFFGRRVYDREDDSVKSETLDADIYGIYFSAHWCPPCKAFTPKLVEFYNEVKKAGGRFEIIFVSADRTEDAMFEYMEEMTMPWLAMRHKCSEADDLKEKFNVRGIPKLVILDSNGEVITAEGRNAVQSLGKKAWDEWMIEFELRKKRAELKSE